MGDMAIFGKGDRRRVGRFGLSGRNGAAVCGCGLNRGRGGGFPLAGGVAPDHAQERLSVPAQLYLQRITRQRIFSGRSEEHTSELQSLMRISYAVFCLTKKKKK